MRHAPVSGYYLGCQDNLTLGHVVKAIGVGSQENLDEICAKWHCSHHLVASFNSRLFTRAFGSLSGYLPIIAH